jgi:hypothetical protein
MLCIYTGLSSPESWSVAFPRLCQYLFLPSPRTARASDNGYVSVKSTNNAAAAN